MPAAERILLAVTGLSPQVITETIFALAQGPEPWIPQQVHLLTTAKGAERARLSLLSEDPGWFRRLCEDYALPPIRFGIADIETLTDPAGQPLDDIRTEADNQAAADQITERVRHFTADPRTQLHGSIAGGRKTLGFYLGYALSLYGRQQDRLSHVLVSQPFESSWNFFYPTPYPRVIEVPGGEIADTQNARISLADIPFVRLRHGLPEELLKGRGAFSEAVTAANQNLGPPRLEYDPENGLRLSSAPVRLPPADLAFYLWIATRTQAPHCPPDGAPNKTFSKQYLSFYYQTRNPPADPETPEPTEKALRNGMEKSFFERRKSLVNRGLKHQLGPAAEPYLIQRTGRRGHWRHQIVLNPEQVQIRP